MEDKKVRGLRQKIYLPLIKKKKAPVSFATALKRISKGRFR